MPVSVALPHMNNVVRSSAWSHVVLVRLERISHMPTYETAILSQWYDADAPMWATSTGEDITPYVKAWMSIPEFTP